MIQITLRNALAFYSATLCLIVFLIWLFTEITVRRPHRVLGKQFLWRCVFCGYSYLDEEAEQLSQCPRCGSFNSTEDKHARVVQDRPPEQGPDEEQWQEAQKSRRNPSRRKSPHKKRRGPRKR